MKHIVGMYNSAALITVGCDLSLSGFAVLAEGLDKFILRTAAGPPNNRNLWADNCVKYKSKSFVRLNHTCVGNTWPELEKKVHLQLNRE